MVLALAITMAALTTLGLLHAVLQTIKFNLNVGAFGMQVKRLIRANNIDRAIKLCNAIPKHPISQAIKNVIIHANRIYAMDLAYQESLLELDKKTKGHRLFRMPIFLLLWGATIGMAITILILGPPKGAEHTWIFICMCVYVGGQVVGGALTGVEGKRLRQGRGLLLEIRNELYVRNGEYIPPQHRPRKATEEEVLEWRRSMDGFESEMKAKRDSGTDFDINEEYDKRAGDDGVLPAI